MSCLDLKSVKKSFGTVDVIRSVDLHIKEGEFCVFVGPSGCGKSTLLRMIAGLETVTDGDIFIGDRRVNDLEPAKRGISMVFQSYALYPHMTVRQNMGFALRFAGTAKAEVAKHVEAAAEILGLAPLLNRRPGTLSGGQRQRVAIGRAIVRDPEVFLFDEPLSNLDAELRVQMRVEIARLHKELGTTMIYVTHDQVEAMTMADKIVVLRAGRIEQAGPPMDLYHDPDNRFVAGFIGSPGMNFLPARLVVGGVEVPDLGLKMPVTLPDGARPCLAGLRPEHAQIDPEGRGFRVDLVERLGGASFAYLTADSRETLIVSAPPDGDLSDGATVGLVPIANRLLLFGEDDQRIRPL